MAHHQGAGQLTVQFGHVVCVNGLAGDLPLGRGMHD